MVQQHSYTSDFTNRYKFTGKELDVETGLYYYGARYYNPSTSIWLSVDPLAEKYPNISPYAYYAYVANNPINAIDPDGRDIIVLNNKSGANNAGHHAVLIGSNKTGWTYISKDGAQGGGGAIGKAKYIIKHFDTVDDFRNSDHNKELKSGVYHSNTKGEETQLSGSDFVYDEHGRVEMRYKNAFHIETDSDFDQNAIDAATNTAKGTYCLSVSDCSDVVTSALNKARTKDGKKVKNGELNIPQFPDFWNEYPNNKHDRIIKRNKDIGSTYWNYDAIYPKNRDQYDNEGNLIED